MPSLSVADMLAHQEQNSSAQEAGLCVGDLLVEVDGKATRTMSGQELAAAIRGPEVEYDVLLLAKTIERWYDVCQGNLGRAAAPS